MKTLSTFKTPKVIYILLKFKSLWKRQKIEGTIPATISSKVLKRMKKAKKSLVKECSSRKLQLVQSKIFWMRKKTWKWISKFNKTLANCIDTLPSNYILTQSLIRFLKRTRISWMHSKWVLEDHSLVTLVIHQEFHVCQEVINLTSKKWGDKAANQPYQITK